MKEYQVAMVGMGHIFPHHVKAIEQVPGFKIEKAHDTNLDLRATAENYKLQFCPHSDEVLEDPKIDVVAVAVSLKNHFDVAKEALEAGKHVLLEKPPTETLEQFDELTLIAKREGVLLVTAFHDTFALDLLAFLPEIKVKADGSYHDECGKLTRIECEVSEPYCPGGILEMEALSLGGSWFDNGINAISVVRKLASSMEITQAKFVKTRFNKVILDIKSRVNFNFPGGEGVICVDWTTEDKFKRTTLNFSGGKIVLNNTEQTIYRFEEGGELFDRAGFSNKNARLTNHYIGVYKDLQRKLRDSEDNTKLAREFLANTLKAYKLGGL